MTEFRPVLLTLPSLAPPIALEILPYGLTLHRVILQAGQTHDIVIGPEIAEDHIKQKYTNSIVGRYANRIPVGTHVLERNGIKSEFTAQDNENPRVSLHGGPVGFDAVPWTLLTTDDPPTLFTKVELGHLSSPTIDYAIFRLVSPNGDQGYPGKLVVEALIALIGPGGHKHSPEPPATTLEYNMGSIILVYRAKLDEEGRKVVTPVNLTQHWGFNLEASLREGPLATVKEHTLTIKSGHIAELGPDALSTNARLSSKDHPSHAHSPKKIGDLFPEGGYDDYYFLQNSAANVVPTRIPISSFKPELDFIKDIVQASNEEQGNAVRGNRLSPVVELACEKSGIRLIFDTNQHGVMFYSNGLAKSTSGARKKIHGGSGVSGNGDSYGPGTAAFLEFHEPLAAFLDPKNKDGNDTLLTTEEIYHNYVRCDVLFKDALPEQNND